MFAISLCIVEGLLPRAAGEQKMMEAPNQLRNVTNTFQMAGGEVQKAQPIVNPGVACHSTQLTPFMLAERVDRAIEASR